MQHRRIYQASELIAFQANYLEMAKSEISTRYLFSQKVYGFYNHGKLEGGYIIGEKGVRTVSNFASDEHHDTLLGLIGEINNCQEICCFWASTCLRRNALAMAYAWLSLAFKCQQQPEQLVLYGTNCLALARVYAFPRNSILLHKDRVKEKSTWVFIARRSDFFLGVLSLVFTRLLYARSSNKLRTKMHKKLSIDAI